MQLQQRNQLLRLLTALHILRRRTKPRKLPLHRQPKRSLPPDFTLLSVKQKTKSEISSRRRTRAKSSPSPRESLVSGRSMSCSLTITRTAKAPTNEQMQSSKRRPSSQRSLRSNTMRIAVQGILIEKPRVGQVLGSQVAEVALAMQHLGVGIKVEPVTVKEVEAVAVDSEGVDEDEAMI